MTFKQQTIDMLMRSGLTDAQVEAMIGGGVTKTWLRTLRQYPDRGHSVDRVQALHDGLQAYIAQQKARPYGRRRQK